MNKILPLIGLGALLASCGVSGDFRTSVTIPGVATEYRVGSLAGPSVACDVLYDSPASNVSRQILKTDTIVKAQFTSTGTLGKATVRLDGVETNERDQQFKATFEGANLNRDGTQYTIRFTADTSAEQFLPTSIRPQGITVNPAPTKVRIVSVNEAQRVGGTNSGFRAVVQGTSDQGSLTPEVFSTTTIPVYSECTQTSVTNTDF